MARVRFELMKLLVILRQVLFVFLHHALLERWGSGCRLLLVSQQEKTVATEAVSISTWEGS